MWRRRLLSDLGRALRTCGKATDGCFEAGRSQAVAMEWPGLIRDSVWVRGGSEPLCGGWLKDTPEKIERQR